MIEIREQGSALAALLAGVDLDPLDRDERLEVALAWGRLEAWCAAGKAQALAAFAATPPGDDPMAGRTDLQVAEEYACAARLTRGQAAFDLREAATLSGPLASVRGELERGAFSLRHARKIDGVLSPLIRAIDDPLADPDRVVVWREKLRHLLHRLTHYATDHTPAETRTRGLAWVAREAPEVVETDRRRAVDQRSVEHQPGDNGMGTLLVYGPLDQTASAWRAIDAAARANAAAADPVDGALTDLRTIDQHRADLALDLLSGALVRQQVGDRSEGTPQVPSPGTPRVQVNLTMDFETFLGCASNPASLDGFPIAADYARELLDDAEFRRLILHPLTGELLDRSPTTYRPPKRLAEFVRSRDPFCIVPGCHRPALRCDLDHRDPFDRAHPDRGGTTTRAGLAPLCRAHHLLKTHHDYRLEERVPRLEEEGRGTRSSSR